MDIEDGCVHVAEVAQTASQKMSNCSFQDESSVDLFLARVTHSS